LIDSFASAGDPEGRVSVRLFIFTTAPDEIGVRPWFARSDSPFATRPEPYTVRECNRTLVATHSVRMPWRMKDLFVEEMTISPALPG